MRKCRSKFERDAPDERTHTCDREQHRVTTPHHCGQCGSWWRARIGVVPDP